MQLLIAFDVSFGCEVFEEEGVFISITMKSIPEVVDITCHLEPLYQEIALKYLNESDNIRRQALTQFRNWITKDPNIQGCRSDSTFLLKFLRIKKFNIASSYQLFKEYLTAVQLYPRWMSKLSVDEPLIMELFSDGVCIPLPDRDPNGCQIVIYNLKNLNPDKYNQHDFFRLQGLCYHIFFEDQETQIAGFTEVFNFSGMDMRRYAMFNLVDFTNFCRVIRYAIPIRINKVFILNMPKIIQPMYEVATSLLTPKLKKRVQIIRNQDNFQKLVDIKVYPKEFGGERELQDILNAFVGKMESRRREIRQLSEIKVEGLQEDKKEWYLSDSSSSSRLGSGMVGSFRSLAVD